jgi:hypothetical protein
MYLRNAAMDASQAASFIMSHRKVLREFQFDDCMLRSGTWDEALAPLSRIAGNDDWKQKKEQAREEVMDVPLLLSRAEERSSVDCVRSKMWDDPVSGRKRYEALRKLTIRTKELVPKHVKQLLRNSRFAFH